MPRGARGSQRIRWIEDEDVVTREIPDESLFEIRSRTPLHSRIGTAAIAARKKTTSTRTVSGAMVV